MIRCGHPFHTSCLQSLMASGRVHSCPTCRQRFRAEHVSPVYFNDPKCAEHCDGGQAEPSVADDVVVYASSNAAGVTGADVGASTGARSRNPVEVIIANSSVLAPFNDDASISTSMPSLESVDADYTEASTTNLGRPSREVSSSDIARSIRHLYTSGAVDEGTSPAIIHAMAEADSEATPEVPRDCVNELQRLRTERGAMMVELNALEANRREVQRLWDTAKAALEDLTTQFDACVRELTSAYISDVEDAASFTRQHRFSFNNMNLRQGDAPQQRRAFDRSLNITRGYLSGRHSGNVRFDVYGSRADGSVNHSHPVHRHYYTQQGRPTGRESLHRGRNDASFQPSSRRPVNGDQGNNGGYSYWPRQNFDARDFPIVRVSASGRQRGRGSAQNRGSRQGQGGQSDVREQRNHSSNRLGNRPSVPLLHNGVQVGRQVRHDAGGGRADRQGRRDAAGNQSGRQVNQRRHQGNNDNGRARSLPPLVRRNANPRVNEATRRIDTVRNQVAAARRAMDADPPSLARSRDAQRVIDVIGESNTVPQAVGQVDEQLQEASEANIGGDNDSFSSDLNYEAFFALMLNDDE